jgi:hypothetical protein
VSIILFNYTRLLPIDTALAFIPVEPLKIKFFLTLFLSFFLLEYIIVRLRVLLYLICAAVVGFLGINQFRKTGYNFESAYNDYEAILFSLNKKSNSIFPDLPSTHDKSDAARKVQDAVNYQHSSVRNFAVAASTKYFSETPELYQQYGDVVRYFSVFKTVNERWKYVHDPEGEEYFAKANESLQHFSGDCDDYSALMCAAIKAVGGQARMVTVEGHIFPEVNIGSKNNFDRNSLLIMKRLFPQEYIGSKGIFGHTDENGNVWLNFDYTARHPGGPFMDNKIIRIVDL